MALPDDQTYADRAAVLASVLDLARQLVEVNNEAETTKQKLVASGMTAGGAEAVANTMLAACGPVVMAHNEGTGEFSCSDDTIVGRIFRLLLPDAHLISWEYDLS